VVTIKAFEVSNGKFFWGRHFRYLLALAGQFCYLLAATGQFCYSQATLTIHQGTAQS
jgi:hypothetical protein